MGEECTEKSKVCTHVDELRLCRGRTAHRGSKGIALPFHDHGNRRGEGPASDPGRSLPPGKTRYPFYRRLGGPQGRSGQVRKNSPPPGFDPRTVQPVASRYTYYEVGPKNNWNLNVARELEVVARCAARCRESTPYSSSLPRGVSLG
jgi:hypothetical protein